MPLWSLSLQGVTVILCEAVGDSGDVLLYQSWTKLGLPPAEIWEALHVVCAGAAG